MKFNRVLYKISGESLTGGNSDMYNVDFINQLCSDIAKLHNSGVEIALVIGGGNIFRGINSQSLQIERNTGDNIGMLSTVMNAFVVKDFLMKFDIKVKIFSAIRIGAICEDFEIAKATKSMSDGHVVIFTAGIGQSFFTTDTCAVVRGLQTKCDAVLKGTSVDGVYSGDPKADSDVKRYSSVTYKEIISKQLRIMDIAAISIASDNKIPIYVFSIKNTQNPLIDLIFNKVKYTKISNEGINYDL